MLKDQSVIDHGQSAGTIDEGLRKHMLRVYNYMIAGLGLTGLVAWYATTNVQLLLALEPYHMHLMVALMGAAFMHSLVANKMSFFGNQLYYFGFAGLMGLAVGLVVFGYTGESVARAFFMASGLFAAVSLYGYTTKKDLSGWVPMLVTGFIVAIAATFIDYFFFKSSATQLAISALVVVLSAGVTAYVTQEIRHWYYMGINCAETTGKMAIVGALVLYVQFINMFLSLLRLFGTARGE